jgi:hypothetical protein
MSIKTNLFNAMTGQGKSFEDTYPGAVRGGTQMVDFNLTIVPGEGLHFIATKPDLKVGNNPQNFLLRTIMDERGGEIAGNITTEAFRNRGAFVNAYGVGVGGEFRGIGGNGNATYTPPTDKQLIDSMQRKFDMDFASKVIEWCNNNPNGAKMDVGKVTIAYDKSMVDTLRENAQERLRELQPKNGYTGAPRGSVDDRELPSQSVALAPGRNAGTLASATPEIHANGAQSPDFKNNPTVQQVAAALERNGVAPENQNPSLVAGLAGAAANLSRVQDVALTPHTAFALDRDKFDPAANRASVSMDVANKPFEDVWQKASAALQQAQTPVVLAQAQGQDLEQKQSARTM